MDDEVPAAGGAEEDEDGAIGGSAALLRTAFAGSSEGAGGVVGSGGTVTDAWSRHAARASSNATKPSEETLLLTAIFISPACAYDDTLVRPTLNHHAVT